jgi:hypothetical protein
MEYRTSQIAGQLAKVLERTAYAGRVRDVYPKKSFGECYPTPVLFVDGFGFPDKKAKLQTIEESAMFEQPVQTCYLMKAANAGYPKPKKV